ncbi:hypothetical protein HDU97_009957 [Phlyctochytrium planicorne]|nr:hypothetical protein HDU97_009957 [Phlyctochytrium planicorne]
MDSAGLSDQGQQQQPSDLPRDSISPSSPDHRLLPPSQPQSHSNSQQQQQQRSSQLHHSKDDDTATIQTVIIHDEDDGEDYYDESQYSDDKNLKSDAASTIYHHHDDEPEDPNFVLVPLTPTRFYLVFLSINLILFLSHLDTSIVSTALKAIVTDLGEAPMIPWIGSSYLLTCTASAVLYGSLSEVFGRKSVMLFAIAVFSIGSVICSYARSMQILIVGRAISGIGGGGIATMMFVVVSDIVSLKYRPWYQGIANVVSGVASMVGPVVGGVFSDKATWRWCFLVNIPIGIVAFIILTFFISFPAPKGGHILERLKKADWLGMILLTGSIVCLVTPLQLGGTFWEWDDPLTIALLVVSGVLLGGFIAVEIWVVKHPFFPKDLFTNSAAVAMLVVATLLGVTYFTIPYYISFFFQMCYGVPAIQAGINTTPLIFGSVIAALGGGMYISYTGRHIFLMYMGALWQFVGILLITFLDKNSPVAVQLTHLFITGVGLGLIIASRLIGIQVIVKQSQVGVATGLAQFFRLLGGTLGIAITGTIFNNSIEDSIAERADLDDYVWDHVLTNFTESGDSMRKNLNFVVLRSTLPTEELKNSLVDAFLDAFRLSYRCMLPYPVLTLLLVLIFVRRKRTRVMDKLGM